MFGWRGRIGLLVPSVNTVVEPEGCALLPDGYSVFATRMRNSRSDADDMAQMCAHVDRGVDELLSANVDVIAFACTAGSFFEGTDGEETLRERLRGGSRIEAVTTAGAVAGALRARSIAQRVSMVTPYIPELNDLEVKFLEGWGFDVVSQAGMGNSDGLRHRRCAACGNIPLCPGSTLTRVLMRYLSVALISAPWTLSKRLRRTSVFRLFTSNQATYWQCLRALGHTAAIPGYGRVFELSPVAGPLPVTV